MRKHLTDLIVTKLPFASKGYYYVYDLQLPAFGLRIGRSRKSFLYVKNGRRHPLGIYPYTALKDARLAARTALVTHHLPAPAITAAEAVDEYLRTLDGKKAPNTIKAYSIYLKQLPNEPLTNLTPKKLYAALPSKPSASNLAFATWKAFFSFCVEREHLAANPLLNRKQPNPSKSRSRLLSNDEIRRIWHSDHLLTPTARILILSGQRLNQIQSLKPEWIHADRVIFPGAFMKGRVEHTIPLTPLLSQHLENFHPVKVLSNQLRDFREHLALDHFVLHDFRRFFSSSMAALDPPTPIDVTEVLLDHRTGSRNEIQRTYDRHDRFPAMQKALTHYHQFVLERIIVASVSKPD